MTIRRLNLSSQDEGYRATVPGWPGVYGVGGTMEDAIADVKRKFEQHVVARKRRSTMSSTKPLAHPCDLPGPGDEFIDRWAKEAIKAFRVADGDSETPCRDSLIETRIVIRRMFSDFLRTPKV